MNCVKDNIRRDTRPKFYNSKLQTVRYCQQHVAFVPHAGINQVCAGPVMASMFGSAARGNQRQRAHPLPSIGIGRPCGCFPIGQRQNFLMRLVDCLAPPPPPFRVRAGVGYHSSPHIKLPSPHRPWQGGRGQIEGKISMVQNRAVSRLAEGRGGEG